MCGLDHLDMPARHGVAVARDDQPLDRPGPVRLDGSRHRRGGLAGADHDGPALRRLGQVLRDAQRRRGRRDRGIEHVAQQRAIVHAVTQVACRPAKCLHPFEPDCIAPADKITTACSPCRGSRLRIANSIGFDDWGERDEATRKPMFDCGGRTFRRRLCSATRSAASGGPGAARRRAPRYRRRAHSC